MEFTIRTAGPGDLAGIDALLARAYPRLLKGDYPPSLLVTALPLISRAQPRLIASGSYYLAETSDRRIVGAGGWTRAAPGAGGGSGTLAVGHVRHVVTDDRVVRRGIGRALMAHVFAQARAAGVSRLMCQATRTAVPFYAACGFTRLRDIAVPLAAGITFPAVEMRRDL